MKPTYLSNHTKAVIVDMYQAIMSTGIASPADAVDILVGEWNSEHVFPPEQLTREEVEAVLEEYDKVDK